MDSDRFYLDFNATSPLSASVLDWLKSGDVLFANPSSQHTLGKQSRKAINESRQKIFSTFGKTEKDSKLFFHSGATEAFLTFTYSFTEWARIKGRDLLVCYSKIDHPAVTGLIERYWGPHVKFFPLKLNPDLTYDHGANLLALKEKKADNPELIILYHHLWVHNETGLVSPLEELRPFKVLSDLYLHIDAVQSPGKIPNWRELLEGDVWSFSAHKFGALKGVGLSLMKKDLPFYPLILGGGQQQGMRSGTENPMSIKSVALALADLEQVDVNQTTQRKNELLELLNKELVGLGATVVGPLQNSNTIFFYLDKLTSDLGLALFDLQGLMLSAGSACSSGAAKPSLILTQLGLVSAAKNGLRISLSPQIDEDSLNRIKKRFTHVFNKLRM